MDGQDSQFIDIRGLAEIIPMSVRTIQRHIREAKKNTNYMDMDLIPAWTELGTRRFWHRTVVEAWITRKFGLTSIIAKQMQAKISRWADLVK